MKQYIIIALATFSLTAGAQQTGFLSLSKDEARQMALKHSEELQKATIDVLKAEEDRKIAFAAYLPKLDITGGSLFMTDMDMMGQTFRNRGAYMASVQLTEPVYAGGQITAANKLAQLGKDCRGIQQTKTRQQVIADVDKAYYTLISVQSKSKMLEAFLAQLKGLGDKVHHSVDAELATQHDMLRIKTKISELLYQIEKVHNGEELCQLSLLNTLGLMPDQRVIPTDTLFTDSAPEGLTEDLTNRPDLQLLEKNIDIKKTMVKKERSNYLPTVALSGGFTAMGNMRTLGETTVAVQGQTMTVPYELKMKANIWTGLVVVKIPVWHWKSEIRKVNKAKLDVRLAQLDLQKNSKLMQIEVRQAVQNVTSGYHMILTARQGQNEADENLRVMREKYDNSMATLTDLLEVEAQWSQSHSNLIEAEAQYRIYQTEYLRVTGKL